MLDEKTNSKVDGDPLLTAYYRALVSAFVENRMEHDKQILVFSALALGLLVVLGDRLSTAVAFWVWLADCAVFAAAILLVLRIFKQNADYLVVVIRHITQPVVDPGGGGAEKIRLDKSLKRKTRWALRLFATGVVLLVGLGVEFALPRP